MNEAASESRVHREVVSFVRRSTRMRANQRAAWDRHYNEFVLDLPRVETSTSVDPEAAIDLEAVFGRSAPLVVEIGPGTGESLIPMSAARPDRNILVFEVYRPAIARILLALGREGLSNVRIAEADAVAGLTHLLGPQSISEVWTFFPDPWPKARHHKRRLVDEEFAALIADRLRIGGGWRLATDWADYAEQMRTVLDAEPRLVNEHDGWAPRWDERPVTRFEARGREAGRAVADLSYRRVG